MAALRQSSTVLMRRARLSICAALCAPCYRGLAELLRGLVDGGSSFAAAAISLSR